MNIENITLDNLIDKIDSNTEESKTYIHLLTAMNDWGEGECVKNYLNSVKQFLGIEELNLEELEKGKKRKKLNSSNDWKLESICELIIFFKLRTGQPTNKPKNWWELWKSLK